MVDRGGLENRCTLAGTEGSNPSLSANYVSFVNINNMLHEQWSIYLQIYLRNNTRLGAFTA